MSLSFDKIEAGLLEATVRRALRHGGDYADVYVEDRRSLGLTLDDGKIERTSGGHDYGAAVRLTIGDRTYHAYSDEVSEDDLGSAADAVAAALRGSAASTAQIAALGSVREEPRLHARLPAPRDRRDRDRRPTCCASVTRRRAATTPPSARSRPATSRGVSAC